LSSVEGIARIYLDPVCPFAWIASRWVREVQALRPDVAIELRLMSIAVLNEGRELDPWYREFNDSSWPTVRVAAALEAGGRFEEFYEAFGRYAHVERRDDWDAVLPMVMTELGLPASYVEAAVADPATEQALRATHAQLCDAVGLEAGTPTLVVDGVATFGPVLRAIPRGDHALALWDAMTLLATVPALTEVKRGDDRPLARV